MLTQDRVVGAEFRFQGPMGDRVQANVTNWLLTAPEANPGMLEMFRLRDRLPAPDLMPWAGEFAGKYLVSLVQANRMSGDPKLRAHTREFVRELIGTQDTDGYLGPFTREERLLGHWDLWGHYYVVLGLVSWYEDTGDEEALRAACRIGDLVCATYLGTGKRVLTAGSCEMNMGMIDGLGALYRHTGEERYLAMMREIEKDWESAGDYFRTGVARVPFHKTPRPRWESLSSLQGLLELYEATGDERYRDAMLEHWNSIRTHDRHPSGAYSTNEQSIGNPYGFGAIETCCTIAWAALTVDVLRATGSPLAADELELSTWNAILGAQHPSGRWCTYDTPMDGVRLASAHHIVFQARKGTPELNCCSVHGPRGLGLLSEWAVMLRGPEVTVNYYGPFTCRLALPDGGELLLTEDTAYPADGAVRVRLGLREPATFPLLLRIPAWSEATMARVNDEKALLDAPAGSYLRLEREWRDGDTITLDFDMAPRYWAGELNRSGFAAIYRGPLLLAYDQRFNPDDTFSPLEPATVPAIDAEAIQLSPAPADSLRFPPLLVSDVPAAGGRSIRLCDYATAGAHGTAYRSWLPITHARPASFSLVSPVREARVGPAPIVLEWTGWRTDSARTFELEVARDGGFEEIVASEVGLERARCVLREDLPGGRYFWRVRARGEYGVTAQEGQPESFVVDPALPAGVAPAEVARGTVLLEAGLNGAPEPATGSLVLARDVTPCPDRSGTADGALLFNGSSSLLTYAFAAFPPEEYTFSAWIRPEGLPLAEGIGQIASAWCGSMDDPLRLCIAGEGVTGRIEAGAGFGTPTRPLRSGEWVHVALVKEGSSLRLFVAGEPAGESSAPWELPTSAKDIGIGGNPHYTAVGEFFRGAIDDVILIAGASTPEEVRALGGRSIR